MTAPDDGFMARWQAAVTRLRMQAEVVQATTDDLPLDVKWASDCQFRPDPLKLLGRHVAAFQDYTTALACVQALLWQYGDGNS